VTKVNSAPGRILPYGILQRLIFCYSSLKISSAKLNVASHRPGRYYFGGESLRILIVEDETKVARALQEGLEREEYDVVVARSGEEGFYLVSAEEFDLVILDLMLPGRDGLQVLSTLRKRGLVTPVLILTARDAIEDRVQGLDPKRLLLTPRTTVAVGTLITERPPHRLVLEVRQVFRRQLRVRRQPKPDERGCPSCFGTPDSGKSLDGSGIAMFSPLKVQSPPPPKAAASDRQIST